MLCLLYSQGGGTWHTLERQLVGPRATLDTVVAKTKILTPVAK